MAEPVDTREALMPLMRLDTRSCPVYENHLHARVDMMKHALRELLRIYDDTEDKYQSSENEDLILLLHWRAAADAVVLFPSTPEDDSPLARGFLLARKTIMHSALCFIYALTGKWSLPGTPEHEAEEECRDMEMREITGYRGMVYAGYAKAAAVGGLGLIPPDFAIAGEDDIRAAVFRMIAATISGADAE